MGEFFRAELAVMDDREAQLRLSTVAATEPEVRLSSGAVRRSVLGAVARP
jgi:hypothetical protein